MFLGSSPPPPPSSLLIHPRAGGLGVQGSVRMRLVQERFPEKRVYHSKSVTNAMRLQGTGEEGNEMSQWVRGAEARCRYPDHYVDQVTTPTLCLALQQT